MSKPFNLLSTALIASLGLSFIQPINNVSAQSESIIRGDSLHYPEMARHGMSVSQHHLASKVGADIMAKGGNAIDAAVAVGFALAVVLPRAGNIGGGGFMIAHIAETGETVAIDYREMAPASAFRDMYLDDKGEVDNNRARFTRASSGVPGTVAGMAYALEKWGTMSMAEVLAPAIELAEDGFAVSYEFSRIMASRQSRYSNIPTMMKYFYKPDGSAYEAGEVLVQKDLAKTLRAIANGGADAFYKGEIADLLVAEMQRGNGFITKQDMANYKVREMKPVMGTYRGYQVASMPPPSSGGVHVIQMLNTLENFDVKSMGFGSADHYHLLAESMKRAYADRSEHLGDPDFWPVPVSWLTSKEYGKQIARNISMEKATPSAEIKPGKPAAYESPDTTHYSVMDGMGNAVTNTYTLNFSYGSGIAVDGAGFLLNNEMDDFSAKPGAVNGMGLIGGDANAIRPGARPLSSMTPTMVLKEGKPYLLTGSPGGGRIINAVLQTIVNVIDHDMNIADAANAPRIHQQWLPDVIFREQQISPDTLAELTRRGQTIAPGTRVLGDVQLIMSAQGWIMGASDPRRPHGAAIGLCLKGRVGSCN